MIPIPIGPEPAPEYHWVGAPAAKRIRSRCATAGVVLLLWALAASGAILLVGSQLPTAGDPFSFGGVSFAALSAVMLLIVAVCALGARQYVSTEHVNVAGGQVLGRLALAMAVFGVVCAALAAAMLLLAAAVEPPAATSAVVLYLLLPGSCVVIALGGAVLVRGALRPPPPPVPGWEGP